MQWVSVKDRMPLESLPVYVYHDGIIDTKIYHRGVFYSGVIHNSIPLGKVSNVTHWMYVPTLGAAASSDS